MNVNCVNNIHLLSYMYFSISDHALSVYMRRSVENGRNFKSFSGFRISCKSSTCLSTFVTAILSALLVIMMHGKSFFIM